MRTSKESYIIKREKDGKYLFIITMNSQGLNSPMKRLWTAGWIKMFNQIICCLQQMYPLKKINICSVWKDRKGASNQACKAIIRPDKTDFKTGLVKREKEVHITLVMFKSHQDEITIATTTSMAYWILLNKYY
jgi:hypothetical protein